MAVGVGVGVAAAVVVVAWVEAAMAVVAIL
jgi:hypothetical protein